METQTQHDPDAGKERYRIDTLVGGFWMPRSGGWLTEAGARAAASAEHDAEYDALGAPRWRVVRY